MSAFLWDHPEQRHPILPEWGNANNFEWRPVDKKYWCKLCGKYVDDKHIKSNKHQYREKYPEIYLWYLNENRQPFKETVLTVPPPPPGPPFDYWPRNDTTRAQGPPRGYQVGPAPPRVPPPPHGPPPELDAASYRLPEKQRTSHHLFDAATGGSATKSTYIIDEASQGVAALQHEVALSVSADKPKRVRFADLNQSFEAIPIGIACGDELQLPPASASCNGNVELLVSPYPFDTKASRGTVQNETISYVSNDPGSIVSNQWHRYAVDESQAAFWWWNPVDLNLCFREDTTQEWRLYSDQLTGKTYWYMSNEIWFWVHTGNTMC